MREIKLRGLKFYVHDEELGDGLSRAIVRDNDFYEAEILDYIRDNYPDQRTIVDAGANIGNHSVYFKRYLGPELIYAFEPVKANYDILFENLNIYKDALIQMALSNKKGLAFMKLDTGNFGAHTIDPEGTYDIKTITLDHFNLQDVTLFKIDCEWHEPQVLEGAAETIQRCKPLILIEDTGQKYAELLPDYQLVEKWEEYSTYLYEWRA